MSLTNKRRSGCELYFLLTCLLVPPGLFSADHPPEAGVRQVRAPLQDPKEEPQQVPILPLPEVPVGGHVPQWWVLQGRTGLGSVSVTVVFAHARSQLFLLANTDYLTTTDARREWTGFHTHNHTQRAIWHCSLVLNCVFGQVANWWQAQLFACLSKVQEFIHSTLCPIYIFPLSKADYWNLWLMQTDGACSNCIAVSEPTDPFGVG